MHFDSIFRNAKIVTPTGLIEGDVGVFDGKIQSVGKISAGASHGSVSSGSAPLERDLSGLFILPGLIDMHVHLRDPGAPEKEDFSTGSAAAAAGGVTTIMDMPNTSPPTTTCATLEAKRKIAAAKSHVNFGFYMGATGDNLDEISKAKNIAGVKLYMASTTGNLLLTDPAAIERLFELKKFVIVHAEDEAHIQEHMKKYKDSTDPSVHSLIRSDEVAVKAVRQILHLAKKCNARVHVTHVSTEEELNELRKFQGKNVSADATPHHLFLTQAAYAQRGNFVKVNPALRSNEDRLALWKGLREGLLQAVATDHAPHTKAEKELPYQDAPAGAPGLETMLPLLLDAVNHGELTLRDVVRLTAENPSRILGIKNKGRIEAGYDADFVVVDMAREMEVGSHGGPHHGYFTKCGWSPFSGRKLKGWPVMTFVHGQAAFENGKIQEGARGGEVVFG